MLSLVVVGPNKRKLEIECESNTTFGHVKERVEATWGVPQNKQRLLCNGKERKNGRETLAAAGVKQNTKLMLMLVPGYSMPASSPDTEATVTESSAPSDKALDAPSAVEVQGDLPLPEGVSAALVPGLVHIKQSHNRFHIQVPQGLASATFGELAKHVSTSFLPGTLARDLRFLAKGKSVRDEDALGLEGANEVTVMLLFRGGFHDNADSLVWLRDSTVELEEAINNLNVLENCIKANFFNEETVLKLQKVGGTIATLKQSVDCIKWRDTSLSQLEQFRTAVEEASMKVQSLSKSMHL